MKTMLGPRYDDQVAEENRFNPSMLSNYLKSLKVSTLSKDRNIKVAQKTFLTVPIFLLLRWKWVCS